MITEQDLQAAIAECQAVSNPNSNTCIKLAAFYTIKEHMFPKSQLAEENSTQNYSYASSVNEVDEVTYKSDTEFSQAIHGKKQDYVLSAIDELMETLSVLNPRLYASVLRKLREGG